MSDPARILVVDDEEVVLLSIQRIFKRDNFSIDMVQSAYNALEKLKTHHYDVVISDIKMPGMSGLELLKSIREMDKKIRIIMITGYATMTTAIKALRQGAFDFIAKPFRKEELRSVVIRAIRQRENGEDVLNGFETAGDEKKIEAGKIFIMMNHSWARIKEDGRALIGVEKDFLKNTKDIINVETPEVGGKIEQGSVCARLTAVDAHVHICLAPLSGKIVELNEAVTKDPSKIMKDPREEGWLMVIEPTNIEFEVENLAFEEKTR